MAEKLFEVLDNDIALAICGPFNNNINHMEKTLNSAIICRGTTFKVTGDEENVNNTISALTAMEDLHKRGTELDEQAVRYCVSLVFENEQLPHRHREPQTSQQPQDRRSTGIYRGTCKLQAQALHKILR